MISYKPISIFLIALFSLTFSASINSQLSENFYNECTRDIGTGFVHNSQPLKALLTGAEVAEFRTTLYDGNIYRFVTCTPGNNKIWFSVYDTNNKLLFSSKKHNNSSTWDFKMEGNIECIIEAGLMPESGDSGLAMLLIGFKKAGDTN